MSLFKKIFAGPEPEELTMVAEIVLGRRDEPATKASAAGIVWNPTLQAEWVKRYTRCSGCNVWIKGRRSLWCDYCKNKSI